MKYNVNEFPKHFVYAKDLSGKYLFMSETFAEIAGFDSPAQMIGRRDTDIAFWEDLAQCWRRADIQAYQGNTVLNWPELTRFSQQPDKLRQTLATKTALRDNQNNIIGVIASNVDITEYQILKSPGHFDITGRKFVLNDSSSEIIFSKKQTDILRYMMMGYSATDIGQLLNRSKRTIEGHIEHLKNKLQCNSKAEIIRWVVTSGLVHSLR